MGEAPKSTIVKARAHIDPKLFEADRPFTLLRNLDGQGIAKPERVYLSFSNGAQHALECHALPDIMKFADNKRLLFLGRFYAVLLSGYALNQLFSYLAPLWWVASLKEMDERYRELFEGEAFIAKITLIKLDDDHLTKLRDEFLFETTGAGLEALEKRRDDPSGPPPHHH